VQPETHFASLRELEGVANEIDDDLPQTARVADHLLGHLGANIEGEFQTLLMGAQGQRLDGRSQGVSQV